MDTRRALVLFGAPGSGKGTQGRFLEKITPHLHISSGEILRQLPRDTELGKLFYSYTDRGELAPDEMMVKVFNQHIDGLVENGSYDPKKQLLMLDGIPRTVPQVHLLEGAIEVVHVVYFDVGSKEELIERIEKRAKIEGRSDDASIAIMEKRMQIFEDKTLKVMEAYPKEKLVRIDATKAPLQVLSEVLERLAPVLA